MNYEKIRDTIFYALKEFFVFLKKITGLADYYESKGKDEEFLSETQLAYAKHSHPLAHVTLRLVGLSVLFLLLWASFSSLDEVTVGVGEIVSSTQVQKIQHLEGGILSDLLVKEGDIVDRGQTLLRVDKTIFESQYLDGLKQKENLEIIIQRLDAEKEGLELSYSAKDSGTYAELVARESKLYASRKEALEDQISSLEDTLQQFKKESWDNRLALTRLYAEAEQGQIEFPKELLEAVPELVEKERHFFLTRKEHLLARSDHLKRMREFVFREFNMNQELLQSGATSEIELLRLERELHDIDSEIHKIVQDFCLSAASEARGRQTESFRLERQIRDVEGEIEAVKNNFHVSVVGEHKERLAELQSLNEQIVALKDRLQRTEVYSPIRGSVNRIHLATLGGVIQPGMDLMEVVALDDTLLVEAKIRPADIAFIRPGQKVHVKVSAYDFSIYGGLKGELEQISSDTHRDEYGEEYYKILVRTEKNHLGNARKPLHIIPGMTVSVDILTGKKTILSYLLKPFNKVWAKALRER